MGKKGVLGTHACSIFRVDNRYFIIMKIYNIFIILHNNHYEVWTSLNIFWKDVQAAGSAHLAQVTAGGKVGHQSKWTWLSPRVYCEIFSPCLQGKQQLLLECHSFCGYHSVNVENWTYATWPFPHPWFAYDFFPRSSLYHKISWSYLYSDPLF